MEPKLRGVELLRAAVNQVIQHPETWDQNSWHCGTKHCIAGWCEKLAFGELTANPDVRAQDAIGITVAESRWLFASVRSLPEIHRFAVDMSSGICDGYDRDGYDRDGYNCDGYNRYGYNRDGYDRNGYNRDGYDRDGFHRDGYNRYGYGRDGKSLPLL